jgi:hypothetical protein
MTPAQQFKLGFVTRCLEEGLTAEMVEERVKQAGSWQDYLPNTLLGGAATAAGAAGSFASPTTSPLAYGAAGLGLVGAGAYLGNQVGKSFSQAKLVNPVDVKEVQHQELMQAYAHHRQRLLAQLARQGVKPSQLQAAM